MMLSWILAHGSGIDEMLIFGWPVVFGIGSGSSSGASLRTTNPTTARRNSRSQFKSHG
jgi:hypothetical protein